MRVSLIIPTFDRAHCLARALDSALAQTSPVEEIILVDDGSNDGTRALAARYPSVRYLYQTNRGVSAARNRGIRAARFEWIALLDSDDEWHPHKLGRQRDALNANPGLRLCHCEETWIRNGRRVNPMRKHAKARERPFFASLPRCAISPSSVLVRGDLLDVVGLFDESLPACEDYDLWLRICANHAVLLVDEPLVTRYGGHTDQLSRRHWGMDRFRVRSLDRLLRTGTLTDEQRQAATRTLLEKLDVLLGGARKHGNRELLEQLRPLNDRYRNQVAGGCAA